MEPTVGAHLAAVEQAIADVLQGIVLVGGAVLTLVVQFKLFRWVAKAI